MKVTPKRRRIASLTSGFEFDLKPSSEAGECVTNRQQAFYFYSFICMLIGPKCFCLFDLKVQSVEKPFHHSDVDV